MRRLHDRHLERSMAVLSILLACTASGCAQARHGAEGGAGQSANRLIEAPSQEYSDFRAGLDSLWIAFGRGSAALSPLDRLVLDDLAVVLAENEGWHLWLWASAPDARTVGSPATGSDTELARRRRETVRQHLLRRGVRELQLRTKPDDPSTFPTGVDWRGTGGTFLFVARREERIRTAWPPVRVRVRPKSHVFFLPRAVADRDSLLVCAPPRIALLEGSGTDTVIVRPYPPRRVVAVARDSSGVIRTRRHDVDPRRSPNLVDLITATPEPLCP